MTDVEPVAESMAAVDVLPCATSTAPREHVPTAARPALRQRLNQWKTTDSAGLLRIDCDMLGKLSLGSITSANQ